MADWYCDNTNGNDTTGDGSTGTPYQTLQKILDVAAGGDNAFVANTSAQPAVVYNFTGITTSTTASFKIAPWDNGGSITVTLPDGTTALGWEIDGGAGTNTFKNTLAYSSVRGLYIHNFGDAYHIWLSGIRSSIYDCEVTGGGYDLSTSGTVLLAGQSNNAINCYVHNVDGGGIVKTTTYQNVIGCKINDCVYAGITSTGNYGSIVNNLIYNCADGLSDTGISDTVCYNTFDNCSADAVRIGTYAAVVNHNVITNCLVGIVGTVVRLSFVGSNVFWNNSTDTNLSSSMVAMGHDIVEASNPYVNSAADDYRLLAASTAGGSTTTNYGALPVEGGAGGGGLMKIGQGGGYNG
jgi:hypothetical protein